MIELMFSFLMFLGSEHSSRTSLLKQGLDAFIRLGKLTQKGDFLKLLRFYNIQCFRSQFEMNYPGPMATASANDEINLNLRLEAIRKVNPVEIEITAA